MVAEIHLARRVRRLLVPFSDLDKLLLEGKRWMVERGVPVGAKLVAFVVLEEHKALAFGVEHESFDAVRPGGTPADLPPLALKSLRDWRTSYGRAVELLQAATPAVEAQDAGANYGARVYDAYSGLDQPLPDAAVVPKTLLERVREEVAAGVAALASSGG